MENQNQQAQATAVHNWFDDPIDPDYFSLNDSVNDLQDNPQAKQILDRIMKQAVSAFGDVAKENKMPDSIAKKMNAVPLSKQIKMVERAFKPGQLDQYNRELQEIHK